MRVGGGTTVDLCSFFFANVASEFSTCKGGSKPNNTFATTWRRGN